MSDEDWKEFIKKEMGKSIDDIMAEIEADPKMKDVKPPEGMYEELMEKIHEHERQTIYEQLSDEDKELIQLGKVYKKKRRFDRFVVVLAAMIVGLWLGSVCIGDEGDILKYVSRMFSEREQEVVNSDSVEPIVYIDEAEVYEKIEKEYGFSPVKLEYLPEKSVFVEAVFGTDIQGINLFYGMGKKANIIYIIRPNYREASFATDLGDKKIHEYQMVNNGVNVLVREYRILETDETRWAINFEYQDVQYMLRITDIEQDEVVKIVKDLHFKE